MLNLLLPVQDETKLLVTKSVRKKQCQNLCSGPPPVCMDLNTCHDWPVKNGIINYAGWRDIQNAIPHANSLNLSVKTPFYLRRVSNVSTKFSYIFFPSIFFKNTSSSGLFLCKLKFILHCHACLHFWGSILSSNITYTVWYEIWIY